jgi:dihydroorotate dehydrogenase (fumarate)
MRDIDLSVKVKGLTFRNPILPGSSEIVQDERGVSKCIEQGLGGIVTKSFTSMPARRTRARPSSFNYRVFGKGLEGHHIGMGSLHPLSSEQAAEKLVPNMARLCRDEGIPFIVSICNGPDIEQWVADAKRFEQAGADMLELNFGRASTKVGAGTSVSATSSESTDLNTQIIKAIKGIVNIPISGKRSISWDPSEHWPLIKEWAEAGIDFMTCHNSATFGMLIDVEEEVPFGGLGGAPYGLGRAYLPINLLSVIETMKITDVPIIATGGVYQAMDAIMYLLVGCPLVEVCSAVFQNGYGQFGKIIKGIEEWMKRKGYSSINDFRGKSYDLATKTRAGLIPLESPFPIPSEKSSPIIPAVDMDKCTLCSKCEDVCLAGVFTVDKGRGIIDIDHENKCWGCGDCAGWCPKSAISMIDVKTKEVVWDNHGLAKMFRPENWRR